MNYCKLAKRKPELTAKTHSHTRRDRKTLDSRSDTPRMHTLTLRYFHPISLYPRWAHEALPGVMKQVWLYRER
jgi:hypothetical protein